MTTDAEKLLAVRDLLMPGIWMFSKDKPDYEFDIWMDFSNNYLIVKGYRLSTNKLVGHELFLSDNLKTEFHPMLEKIYKELREDD